MFLMPFITTYLGYLIHQKEKLLKKAEAERAKGESILEAIGDAISIQDTSFKILYQNRLHKEMMGRHGGEYCYKAFHNREQVCEGCHLAMSFRDGETHKKEQKVITDKGTVYLEIAASPLTDLSGNIVAGIDVVRDVTERRQSEELLRESEEKFRTLFESANDAIFICSLEGNLIDINRTAHERLGYTREEMLSMHLAQLDPPEFARKVPERIEQIKTYGKAVFESAHVRKDGTIMPVEINTRIIDYGGRQVVFSIVRDISERKRAENVLRESEQRTAALNNISKAFLTGGSDEEMYDEVLHIVLEVMDSPYGVFGYIDEQGDLVCPSMTRHIWSKCQMSHKSIVFPNETWGNSIWGNGLLTGKPWYQNAPFSVPQGHVPIDKCLTVPLLHMGRTIGLLTVANKRHDYTDGDLNFLQRIGEHIAPVLKARLDRERSVRALQESEDRLRQATRVSQIGIFDHEHLTDTIYWSPRQREIHGWGSDEPVTLQAFLGLVHPDDLERIATEVRRAHDPAGDGMWDVEHRIIRRDGSIRWLTARSQTFFAGEGNERRPVRTVGAVLDVTEHQKTEDEKQKLQEQLLQAQKMEAVGQLAGGIAHDFNNMLTSIIGFATLLEQKLETDSPLKFYLDQILSSSEKSADLTRQLLALSRKQIMDTKETDLNVLVKGIEKLLHRLIGEDIEFKTSLADDWLTAMADSGQIEQVLLNLCTNARDAMPHGGSLTISTRVMDIDEESARIHDLSKPGRYALIGVTDTGIGLDETARQRIFEPFYTTKDIGKGTGLGLSIVYGIIKQHDGHITVYSEPGKGTTFNIYLPLIESLSESAGVRKVVMPVGGTETVLVAEDNNEVRRLVVHVLQKYGYKVIEAVDGEGAIHKFEANKDSIALAMLDVIMPKRNGREASEAIRKIKPGTKILFTSGYTADIITKAGIDNEVVHCISKPLTPQDLLQKIRDILDK